ncbi:hypothetical protein DFJ73DRAFT_755623 [Zopfochytrium polystomum]|nr:hypothetical protein DFJ73DRAFT_755623 [Zopfochytrium polystomum]
MVVSARSSSFGLASPSLSGSGGMPSPGRAASLPNPAPPKPPAPEWRAFSFFDKELVVDAEDPQKPPAWLQEMDVTVISGGRGSLFFGDVVGGVYIVNHSLTVIFSFQAFSGPVTHLKVMRNKNILVAIGDDDGGVPVMKVWNLDKLDTETKVPSLIRSMKIQHNNKIFPVTALAVLESMAQAAIGLENGVVLVMRGDLSRAKIINTKAVHEGSEPVTGLGFNEDGKSINLYVVTLARTLIICTTNKDATTTLEDQGSEMNCSMATPEDQGQHMVIGKKEAVYFYGPDGRGPCFIIDSEKVSMTWFRNYLAVVSKPPSRPQIRASLDLMGGSASALVAAAAAAAHADDMDDERHGTVLTLYDLKSKFVAFQGSFGAGEWDHGEFGSSKLGSERQAIPIRCVASEWGQLFVTTADRKMYRIEEKDLTSKLDLLYRKNMYSLALSIVSSSSTAVISEDLLMRPSRQQKPDKDYDAATVKEIHKRYGDWLYSKSDYDAAMIQYQQTIGYLEPSYVIRKFLDAERLQNLTSFLQSLHEVEGGRLANADHTTLLINCYTKLKDGRRLDEFIKREEVVFDADTAIRVCRTAHYFDHALWLSERFNNHEQYLHIQVEDRKNFVEAVAYVSRLPLIDQERELKRYGAVLVDQLPSEMTDVLVRICTPESARPSIATGSEDSLLPAAKHILYPEEFLHLFVGTSEWCITFLERVLESRWGISGAKGKKKASEPVAPGPTAPAANGSKSDLESRDELSLKIVCNTLFELYLDNVDPAAGGHVSSVNEQKTLSLLKNPKAIYDADHTLVMCELRGFQDGILLLLEKMNRYEDVMRFHMENNNYASVIATCRQHGDKDKGLWSQALTYFADKVASDESSQEASQELAEVLDVIDRKSIMPPLEVIQIVAKNRAVTIGMARKLSASYRQETAKMKAQIEELKSTAIVFQASKCSLCTLPLELPTAHFMCRHSFHARCLSDHLAGAGAIDAVGQGDCPRCAPEHQMVLDMLQNQAETATRFDLLKKKLDGRSDDRYAVIAEYLGKNIFGAV